LTKQTVTQNNTNSNVWVLTSDDGVALVRQDERDPHTLIVTGIIEAAGGRTVAVNAIYRYAFSRVWRVRAWYHDTQRMNATLSKARQIQANRALDALVAQLAVQDV
jgi:hypothetical protein